MLLSINCDAIVNQLCYLSTCSTMLLVNIFSTDNWRSNHMIHDVPRKWTFISSRIATFKFHLQNTAITSPTTTLPHTQLLQLHCSLQTLFHAAIVASALQSGASTLPFVASLPNSAASARHFQLGFELLHLCTLHLLQLHVLGPFGVPSFSFLANSSHNQLPTSSNHKFHRPDTKQIQS